MYARVCVLMQQLQALLTLKNKFKGTLVNIFVFPVEQHSRFLKSPFSTKPRGEAVTSLLTNFTLKQ